MHGLWCPYCYRASGMPGMPFPAGGAASPRPPLGPIRFHPSAVALGEADGTERAASGLGSRRQRELPPSRKGYSWLFYKYIYIFFVARYCYLTLGLGLRGRARIPNWARGRQPRCCSPVGAPTPPAWPEPSQCPWPSPLQSCSRFFSDVIFKTSDIACLLGHCWQ